MAKLFKFILILIVILALLLGALAFYLLKVFDPNDYKAEIQQLVKQQTQLELSIGGDLALSVFPWLGIAAKEIAVRSGEEELASAKAVQVFAKLRPLLDGRLVVDGVKLDTLKLNLVVDRNGKGNWEIEPRSTQAGPPPQQQVTPAGASLAALSVGAIEIEHADISYRDLRDKSHHRLFDLELLVSNPQLNQSFPLSADFKYLSAATADGIPAHLTSNIRIDLDNQRLAVNDLTLDLDQARVTGQITAEQILEQPKVVSRLKVTDLNPSHWAKLLGLQQNSSLKGLDTPFTLELNGNLDSTSDRLTLDSFSATSKLIELEGNATLSQVSTKPQASGKLSLKSGDLKQLLQITGNAIPTTDPKALTWLASRFSFNLTEELLNIQDLALELDESKISGQLGIHNFSKPQINFTLSGNTLNLDRYLPAASESDSAQAAAAATSSNALLLPLALLKALNMQGRLQLEKLIASGLTIENLVFKTKANNGFIRLEQMSGDIYEGQFNATGIIDARGNTAQMQFNKRLTNMQAGPVLKALAEVDYISGKLDLSINATALGNSLEQIKRNLNGKAEFSVTDGVLGEINLEQMVCQGIAQIRQLQFTPGAETDTRFNRLDGRFTITQGELNMDTLNIGLNKLKARGSGVISLPQETLDLSIKTLLLGDLENKACEVHPRYRDIEWPVRCVGSWNDDPSDLCSLDRREMQKVIGRLAEKELKRKAGGKLEEKIRERFGDELGDQLKQILDF